MFTLLQDPILYPMNIDNHCIHNITNVFSAVIMAYRYHGLSESSNLQEHLFVTLLMLNPLHGNTKLIIMLLHRNIPIHYTHTMQGLQLEGLHQ